MRRELRHIAFDDLTEADLQRLIDNAVPEGRGLEYKRELWLPGDGGRPEFLKDVPALANGHGGDLVIRIEAKNGIPPISAAS